MKLIRKVHHNHFRYGVTRPCVFIIFVASESVDEPPVVLSGWQRMIVLSVRWTFLTMLCHGRFCRTLQEHWQETRPSDSKRVEPVTAMCTATFLKYYGAWNASILENFFITGLLGYVGPPKLWKQYCALMCCHGYDSPYT